jgi:hypothetical protein
MLPLIEDAATTATGSDWMMVGMAAVEEFAKGGVVKLTPTFEGRTAVKEPRIGAGVSEGGLAGSVTT